MYIGLGENDYWTDLRRVDRTSKPPGLWEWGDGSPLTYSLPEISGQDITQHQKAQIVDSNDWYSVQPVLGGWGDTAYTMCEKSRKPGESSLQNCMCRICLAEITSLIIICLEF